MEAGYRKIRNSWKDVIKAKLQAASLEGKISDATQVCGHAIKNTWHSRNWLSVVNLMAGNRKQWEGVCEYHGRKDTVMRVRVKTHPV